MQVLGLGLSRTGTKSLTQALQILGYQRNLHCDRKFIADFFSHKISDLDYYFRERYADIDTVTDIITCKFYKEIMEIYPQCKYILTVRNEDEWYTGYSNHIIKKKRIQKRTPRFTRLARRWCYGFDRPVENLYKNRFLDHNTLVLNDIPDRKILIMDITRGDGWEKLCPFLKKDIPDIPFPCIK